MSDDADRAQQDQELLEAAELAQGLKKAAVPMEQGSPGDCEWCGYYSPRLVRTACAKCRDKFKLG